MGRVDHTFNDNNIIFVRYLHNRYDTKEGDFLNSRPAVFPGLPPLGEVTRIGRNLAARWRRTITPNLVKRIIAQIMRVSAKLPMGISRAANAGVRT